MQLSTSQRSHYDVFSQLIRPEGGNVLGSLTSTAAAVIDMAWFHAGASGQMVKILVVSRYLAVGFHLPFFFQDDA